MDHETIEGLLPAYALGATDLDENRELEAHLSACAACRALLAEYRGLSDVLLYTPPPMAAPADLTEQMRRRLAQARQDAVRRPWWSRLRSGLAVPAMAVAILLLIATNLYWFSQTGQLQREMTEQAAAFAALTTASPIALYGGDPEYGSGPRGVVYAPSGSQLALLCVYGMPALPEDKTYQLWLIKDGKRDSGGLFQVSGDGYGVLMVQPERPLTDYDAVGITVEPSGGSPAPTSPRVLGTQL